jgi:hypothetical protein
VETERGPFVAAVLAALRADSRVTSCTYDAATFAVVLAMARGKSTYFLAGVFQQYGRSPAAERPEVVRSWARSVLELGSELSAGTAMSSRPPPTSAAPRLLPRLGDRTILSILKLQMDLAEVGDAGLPFSSSGALSVTLCEDGPHDVRMVTNARLSSLHTTFKEALNVACENLERITPSPEFSSPAPGVYLSGWHDGHDASRALLSTVIDSLKVKGEVALFLATSNALIVTGTDDARGLAFAADLALDPPGPSGKRLLGYPVRLSPGSDAWTPFEVPPHHPAAKALKRLRATVLAGAYTDQKGLLVALNARAGRALHVADCLVGTDRNGDTITACTWSTAVSLLPVTDILTFVKTETKRDGTPYAARAPVVATRAAAESVVARMQTLKATLLPSRYVVDFFPTDAELDTLERMDSARR